MRRVLHLVALCLPLLVAAFMAQAPVVEAEDPPTTIELPDGWQPEGIVVGGSTLYAGSRRHGGIYAFDLETGMGRILYAGQTGRAATGLEFDPRTGYIFASGAGTGDLHVYDSATGVNVASYKLAGTAGPTFINDVALTPSGAYLTDSMRPVLYKVPLGPDGELIDDVQVIPLSGDYVHIAGFNLNGIEATPGGDRLLVVQTNTGFLFEVNPGDGATTRIELAEILRGDGMLLIDRSLFVVRGSGDVVRVLLSPDYRHGRVLGIQSHPNFEGPTTMTRYANRLYVVNGRSRAGMAPTVESVSYWEDPPALSLPLP